MGLSSLERIEEIRNDIKKITEERELNVPETLDIIHKIKEKYNIVYKEEGPDYCNKNCPDIPLHLNNLLKELGRCKF